MIIILLVTLVEAQPPTHQDTTLNFRPTLGVVIGILGIVFLLSSLIFYFSRFCLTSPTAPNNQEITNQDPITLSRFSGIDKTVIESLPFFKFSSLKGSKEGLECAVCLSKFEDIEVLRLLPKCKHAFHINCVDKWLEEHSSCPLCRSQVSADDLELLSFSNSFRFLEKNSNLHEDSNLEIFVQREEGERGSSRFGFESNFRRSEKGKKEKMIIGEMGDSQNGKMLNKLKYNIVVSNIISKNRWSSASPSDFVFLESEMLASTSSERFSRLENNNDNREIVDMSRENNVNEIYSSRVLNQNERRSISEIAVHTRFDETENGNVFKNANKDTIKRTWLSIARKTVEWFIRGEERSQYVHTRRPPLCV